MNVDERSVNLPCTSLILKYSLSCNIVGGSLLLTRLKPSHIIASGSAFKGLNKGGMAFQLFKYF